MTRLTPKCLPGLHYYKASDPRRIAKNAQNTSQSAARAVPDTQMPAARQALQGMKSLARRLPHLGSKLPPLPDDAQTAAPQAETAPGPVAPAGDVRSPTSSSSEPPVGPGGAVAGGLSASGPPANLDTLPPSDARDPGDRPLAHTPSSEASTVPSPAPLPAPLAQWIDNFTDQVTTAPHLVLQQAEDIEAYLHNEVIPVIQSLSSLEARCDAFLQLLRGLPRLREVDSTGEECSPIAEALFEPALQSFETAAAGGFPSNRLEPVLDGLRHLIGDSPDEASDRRLDKAFALVAQRDPDIARIPDGGHCFWFTGDIEVGQRGPSLSLDHLVNMARYLHLHPDATLTLWSDSTSRLETTISEVARALGGQHTALAAEEIDELGRLLHDDSLLSSKDLTACLARLEVKPWTTLFDQDWGDIPEADKQVLRSSIQNEVHGSATQRYPQAGKDMFMTVALALEGGLAFDLDIRFNRPVRIYDPVGIQCASQGRPQIRAMTRRSPAAMLALTRTAELLGPKERFDEFRKTTSKDGDFTKSALHRKTNEVADMPRQALEELYGEGSHERLTAFLSLAIAEDADAAFDIPEPEFKDFPHMAKRRRRGSAPGKMET